MGYILACVAVLMWSLNSIISTEFATRLTPFELSFGRWFIAAIVLSPFVIHNLKGRFSLVKKHWKVIVLMSVVGMVLTNTILYYAGHTTTAVNISLMNRTSPIFIVVLSAIFLKVPVSFRQMGGMVVAILGVVYIIMGGNLLGLGHLQLFEGDLWMLLSAFSFSVYSILQIKRPPEFSQITMLGLVAASAATILFFPFMYQEITDSHLKNLTIEDYGILLYLGIGLSIVAYLAWNTALTKIGMVKASIITYLSPVSTGLITHYFLGATLTSAQFIGGAMALAGILIVSFSKTRKSPLAQKNVSLHNE